VLILKELLNEMDNVPFFLKKKSVDFFRKQVKKQKTSYQKMIREMVDRYASHYEKTA